MYDNETFIQATGSASNKYTLDLSSCTKSDVVFTIEGID